MQKKLKDTGIYINEHLIKINTNIFSGLGYLENIS